MSENDLNTAREDVARARARMSDTVAQLESHVAGQVDAVKQKLDVVQLVRDHPWTALAIAAGAGAAVAATGADKKAASATTASARKAGSAARSAAKEAPGRAKEAAQGAGKGISNYADTFAASLVSGFIDRLRSADGTTAM